MLQLALNLPRFVPQCHCSPPTPHTLLDAGISIKVLPMFDFNYICSQLRLEKTLRLQYFHKVSSKYVQYIFSNVGWKIIIKTQVTNV